MCVLAQSTVMTTIPQLCMALCTGICVNKNPNTTRDPTYAGEQKNNHAPMPSIYNTNNNTSNYPQDKRTRNARVNPHPSENPKLSCRFNHPSRLASRHRNRYTVPIVGAEKWHIIEIDVKAWQAKKGAAEKGCTSINIWYVPSNDPDGSVKGCVRHPVYIVGG